VRRGRGVAPAAVPDTQRLRAWSGSAELLLVVVVVLWSLNFPLLKYALSAGFDPLAFTALRWVFAALALTATTLVLERTVRVHRRHVLRIAVIIGGSFALNQLAFVYAMTSAPATTVAVLFGLFPVFVALIGHVSGRRLRRRQWIAVGLSCLGAALVAVGAGGSSSTDVFAIALGLGNAFLFALFVALVSPVLRMYSPLRVNAVLALVCAALLSLVALHSLISGSWTPQELAAWLALAYMVVSIVLGNVMWLRAVDAVGPSKASVYANLQPFAGAALAFVLLSEHVTLVQLLGGAVIFGSMMLAQSKAASDRAGPPVTS
jgi:drug/metabolite transporter (DMT)-like permease